MSGKCRASLRAKTLENVKRSLLSQADKNCIAEVFARFEKAHSEIDRLTTIEEEHRKQNGELRIEVERLTKELAGKEKTFIAIAKASSALPHAISTLEAEARSEVIKEFVERVEGYFDGIITDIQSKQFKAGLGYEKELYRTCGWMIEELGMCKQAVYEIAVEMEAETDVCISD